MASPHERRTVQCDQCKGSKRLGGKPCPKCSGEGVIVERTNESGLLRQTKVLNE